MKRGDRKYIAAGALLAPLAWGFFYIALGAGGWR